MSAPAKPSSLAPMQPAGDAAVRATTRRLLRGVGLFFATVFILALALLYPAIERGRGWFYVEWQQPWLLLLLLIVPVVWWWGVVGQVRRRPRMRIGTVVPLRRGPRGWRTRIRDLPALLRSVAVTLFVVALARPVAVIGNTSTNDKGIDIVVVMDLSGSMQAVLDADPQDLPVEARPKKGHRLTRLDVAKVVVVDFIRRRQTDRIGVVVFGKDAYILSPPTLDYQLLSHLVGRLNLYVIDGTRTALGDALGTAVARLRRSDALSKVIILLTDGDSNAGRIAPDYAIDLATTVGAKTYTVQIGDGAEVDVQHGIDLFGQPMYVRRRYPTNPELLEKIAAKTGGQAFIATDAKALRKSFHSILDQLEKTRFEASVAHYQDLFSLFLFPGVFLLGLEALLRALILRRFP
ncbi:MAG: VWA domain-containing protein [Polyangiaceae bacterium]